MPFSGGWGAPMVWPRGGPVGAMDRLPVLVTLPSRQLASLEDCK